MNESVHSVWQKHAGLVWSNPAADDAVRIRAALVRPKFERLLDICVCFGSGRVRAEWEYLCAEPTEEVLQAKPIVERILRNIAKGEVLAAA